MSQTQTQQDPNAPATADVAVTGGTTGTTSAIKGIDLYIGIALGHLFALFVGKWLDKFIIYSLGGDPKNHAIYLYTVGLIFIIILAVTELAPQFRELAA